MIQNFKDWLNESEVYRQEKQAFKVFVNAIQESVSKVGLTIFRLGSRNYNETETLVSIGHDEKQNIFIEEIKDSKLEEILSLPSFEIEIMWKRIEKSNDSTSTRYNDIMMASWEKRGDSFVFSGFKPTKENYYMHTITYEYRHDNKFKENVHFAKSIVGMLLAKQLYVNNTPSPKKLREEIGSSKPLDISSVERQLKDLTLDTSRISGTLHGKNYGV
jgi:hypothetical protein